MDIATIIGILLAVSLILLSITVDFTELVFRPGNLQFFLDFPSLLIVLGGTFGSVLTSYPLARVMRVWPVVVSAFRQKADELIEALTLLIDVSKIARKNILAIEDALPSIDNTFMRNGLRLVVDRVDRELITDILYSEMKYMEKNRDEDIAILKTFATLSPAFGLIGTLIGLVLLLQNLDDPSAIGPAMSVAIITTLYGALMANVMFTPWANKLSAQRDQEKVLQEMIRDGVLYIERGERPDFIEQDLINYLPPNLREIYEGMKFQSARREG